MPSRPRRSPPSGVDGSSGASPQVVIPSHTKDPTWSLQPTPIVLVLGGREYEIPALPAVDWLMILMADQLDLDRILLELCPRGVELFTDETVEPDALYAVLLDVIEQVSGRRWWIALRLIMTVRNNWNALGAEMFFKNIDPSRLSLSGWLDSMLVLTIRALEPKDVAMFVSRLELPPPGEEADTEDMEMSADQFLSMA